MMKKLRMAIVLVGGLVLAEGDQLVPDNLFHDRTSILHNDLRQRGYLERDTVLPNQIRVYDEKGRLRGVLKPDPLFPDR